MAKYVFKNPEVEKALRLVCKELGVSDEQFNEHVQNWSYCSTVYIEDEDGNTVIDFPSLLLKKVKEFNPDGWNDAEVIPPKDDQFKSFSKRMLVEDEQGFAKKAIYFFESKQWKECGPLEDIECSRYRLYPED